MAIQARPFISEKQRLRPRGNCDVPKVTQLASNRVWATNQVSWTPIKYFSHQIFPPNSQNWGSVMCDTGHLSLCICFCILLFQQVNVSPWEKRTKMPSRTEAKGVGAISSDGNLSTTHAQTPRKGKIMHWLQIKLVSVSPWLPSWWYRAWSYPQLPRALHSYKACFMENYFTYCKKPWRYTGLVGVKTLFIEEWKTSEQMLSRNYRNQS